MAAGKRYYWLKLQDDFFNSKRIKKLRKLAGGDTYTIIYLKMQLVAMKHDGILEYTGLESSFAAELALDLDENPDDVTVTVNYLLSCGLMESSDDRNFFLPYALENTGRETDAARRMRDSRARKSVGGCNNVTPVLHDRYGEIEIEKRDRDRDRERNRYIEEELDARAHARETADENTPFGKVITFYLDKVNPTPSSTMVTELQNYVEKLDADVVIHAMGIALDERKTSWSYIRAILWRYVKDGLTTMNAVLDSEQRYQEKKDGTQNGNSAGSNGRTQSKWNLHYDNDERTVADGKAGSQS